MKTYFIGLLLLMTGFTGFLFLKRPGAFAELMSATAISSKLPSSFPLLNNTESNNQSVKSLDKVYPYFTFISGDILLNTEAQSYLAQVNIELRKGDRIMASYNSFAMLALGPEKFLRIGEGTEVIYEEKPRRRRGFYEFKIEKGKIFADIFANKEPIGLKLHLVGNSISMQNATIRLQVKTDGKFLSSMDRGISQFHTPSNNQVINVKAGFGIHNEEGSIKIGAFPWIDDYPWEERINEISKEGYGKEATFKAIPLSKRPSKVKKSDMVLTWKKQKNHRLNREPSKVMVKTSEMLKKLEKKASEGINNVITAPTKITESRESIRDFEKTQNQRTEELDSIE